MIVCTKNCDCVNHDLWNPIDVQQKCELVLADRVAGMALTIFSFFFLTPVAGRQGKFP